jgi:hypothetical protein
VPSVLPTRPAEPPGVVLPDDGEDALCVAFSPDGQSLASGGRRSLTVRRVPGHAIRWRRELEGKGWLRSVDAVAFSPDGQRLAVAYYKAVRVWDVASGALQLLIEHENLVNDVAFHPDGARLATACRDGAARVWSIEGEHWPWCNVPSSGMPILELAEGKWVNAVSFSPEGSRLLTAVDDHTVRVWDLATAEMVLRLCHDGPAVTVTGSPDGKRLLTGSADRTARVWDADSGEELLRLSHRRGLRAAVFDAAGCHIATVADEKTVRIWDAASGELRAELDHGERPQDAAFGPDGHRLATTGYATRIWQLPPLDGPGTVRLDSEEAADSPTGKDDEPTPQSRWVIGAALLAAIGWLVLGLDAPIGDRLWGIGGAVSVAIGLLTGLELRGFGAGSSRYRAEVLARQRLSEHEGFCATIAVTLADGTRLLLPLEAEHKRPRTGAMVALAKGGDLLAADEDPRQADAAVLMHPLETYGWPALFLGFGALALAVTFFPE